MQTSHIGIGDSKRTHMPQFEVLEVMMTMLANKNPFACEYIGVIRVIKGTAPLSASISL